jgi:hypothetical protein
MSSLLKDLMYSPKPYHPPVVAAVRLSKFAEGLPLCVHHEDEGTPCVLTSLYSQIYNLILDPGDCGTVSAPSIVATVSGSAGFPGKYTLRTW